MEILNNVVATLVAAVIIWAIGLPGIGYRKLSSLIKGFRVRRKLATGLFDQQALQAATRYYIRPLYSNVDPANEWEPAHALINARSDLFAMVDRFLKTDFVEQKHMLLFADSGMGKTSFLLNYLDHNYRFTNFRKQKILLVPLSQKSSDAIVEGIPLGERGEINLFLDALDEDPRAMCDVQGRIQQLLALAENFRTVIITCRSQFFRSDEQIPVRTGLAKLRPVPLGKPKHYDFFRVYLSPFDDDQVKRYLRIRFPGLIGLPSRHRAKKLVDSIPSLAVRPMLLAHLPDVLKSNQKIRYAADVYQAMVNAWVQRESDWVDPAALMRFSERLALDLYSQRSRGVGETIDPDEISQITNEIGIPVADLATSRSLLNRTGDGRYKFAHRSIMEFFVTESLLASKPRLETSLTDQMARFLFERLGCWSDEMANLASASGVSIRFVEPHRRLGLATSYGLYQPIHEDVSMGDVLRLKCHSTVNQLGGLTLDQLLTDLCRTSFGVDVSQVADIRLILEESPTSRSSYVIRISAWMNSYCAITEVEVPRVVASLLGLSEAERIPVMLSASPAPGTSELFRAKWTLGSRIDMPAIRGFRAPLLPEGIAIQYKEESNNLLVSILDKALDPPGPIDTFGILGSPKDRSPVKNRPYGLIGPSRGKISYGGAPSYRSSY